MIRILVADQVRLTCTVIASVLEREPDIEVIDLATTVDEALDKVENCDLVLVNSLNGNGNGTLELARAVSRLAPSTKVVVMGMPAVKEIIVQHIEAGIAGYALRDDSVDQLIRTVKAAYRGEATVAPDVAAALMSRIAELANACQDPWSDGAQSADLTSREREVLALVRHGLSNQEIASTLTIELGTVKNHIHNILRKLNVRSRHDAAAFQMVGHDELAEIDPDGRDPLDDL